MKPNDANERLPTSERPFRILIISGSDRGQPTVRPLRCLHRPTLPMADPEKAIYATYTRKFPARRGVSCDFQSARTPLSLVRFQLTHGLKCKVRMRVSAASAHLHGDPNRFHHFLLGRAVLHRKLGMAANAVWALGHMRHRDRDQLLGLRRQRAVGEYLLAESFEGSGDLWRELRPLAREFLAEWGIKIGIHVVSSFKPKMRIGPELGKLVTRSHMRVC